MGGGILDAPKQKMDKRSAEVATLSKNKGEDGYEKLSKTAI